MRPEDMAPGPRRDLSAHQAMSSPPQASVGKDTPHGCVAPAEEIHWAQGQCPVSFQASSLLLGWPMAHGPIVHGALTWGDH